MTAPAGATVTDEEVDGATYTDRDKLLVYVGCCHELLKIVLGRDAEKAEMTALLAPLVKEQKRALLARRKAAAR